MKKNMLFPTLNALHSSCDAVNERQPILNKRYDKLAHSHYQVYLLVSNF